MQPFLEIEQSSKIEHGRFGGAGTLSREQRLQCEPRRDRLVILRDPRHGVRSFAYERCAGHAGVAAACHRRLLQHVTQLALEL